MINNFFIFLSKNQSFSFLILSIALAFSAVLEIVGIGTIPLFVTAIVDIDLFNKIIEKINIFDLEIYFSNQDQILKFMTFAIILIFLIKNLFLFVIVVFEQYFNFLVVKTNSIKLYNKYLNENYSFHLDRNSSILSKNISHEVRSASSFLTSTLTAQDTVWFDSNWNLTSNENATYYRPVPKKIDAGYWIVDYYISGKKQMEGFSTTNEANKETYVGLVTYYHENGQKFQMVNYINGKPVGRFSEFYDSGELKRSGKYDNGLREGSWKVYHKNGKIQEKGKYSSGEKIGIWKTFHKNI